LHGLAENVELPVLIGGERVWPGGDALVVRYDDDLGLAVHRPTVDDVDAVVAGRATAAAALRELSVDDITIFFDRVRARWMDPDDPWRRQAIDLSARATGYDTAMIRSDVDYLGHTLERAKQYDFIETDLGDPALLDEWRPTKAVEMRCWPKGLIAHIMVGNVPLASLFTLYRSLATKNVTVAKVPSRDLASALCFANCIHDTDPSHPVTRALSALYWESGSTVEDMVLAEADAVSVWGQGSTVESIRARLRTGVDLIEFGPKRSLALVLDGAEDLDRIAMKVAFDVAAYDQEACFSVQEVVVEGDANRFADQLASWLARYQRVVPRRQLPADGDAHIQRARIEADSEGWRVIPGPGTEWTVVVTDRPQPVFDHPLSRFVFVHPATDAADALTRVDPNVQTVSLAPWERVRDVADALTAAGADRIVQVGRMTRFRPGFTHDAFHPMRRMVRWVTVERAIETKYRFTDVSPEVYDERLYGPVIRLAEAEATTAEVGR
jgi:long-chain-fatty-acyl-CoA reductase